ncbi:hypothetical protein ACLOJK_038212 [Asimina triloba]
MVGPIYCPRSNAADEGTPLLLVVDAAVVIDGEDGAFKKDGGDEFAVDDVRIFSIRIGHKNRCLMMLPLDLKMSIDAVVVTDDERDGFSLLLPEMGCGLDRFDIVSSSPTCWNTWIVRSSARWWWVRQR